MEGEQEKRMEGAEIAKVCFAGYSGIENNSATNTYQSQLKTIIDHHIIRRQIKSK